MTFTTHLHTPSTAVTFAMLARLEEKQLFIEISKDGAPITSSPEAAIGQSVHLIVEEGLEAFLPLAGMIDYVKERVSITFRGDFDCLCVHSEGEVRDGRVDRF